MSFDWFPFYTLNYRRKTRHLSLAEHGAYRLLIDEYMTTREPLPNDDAALARILGIPTTEWDDLKGRVRPFFRARNDRLLHKTCEEVLHWQDAQTKRASDRGKKAAFARWSKISTLDARAMRAHAKLQEIPKTPTEPVAAREGPSEGVASSQLAQIVHKKWGVG